MAGLIRRRRFPIIGDGGGVWSHVHIEDAAAATAIAVERGEPGIYYIVDDEPVPVREWLPVVASALDARPPMRIPRWLGRLAAGEMATLMMTDVRGASNTKAKRELDWQLRYPSWRLGVTKGSTESISGSSGDKPPRQIFCSPPADRDAPTAERRPPPFGAPGPGGTGREWWAFATRMFGRVAGMPAARMIRARTPVSWFVARASEPRW
jgi:hypothetical protein